MLVSEIPYTVSIYISHKVKKNCLCASAYTQKQKILLEYLGTKLLGNQYKFRATLISTENEDEIYFLNYHYWSGKFHLSNVQGKEVLYSYTDFFSKTCFYNQDNKEKIKIVHNDFVNEKEETLAEISSICTDFCFTRYQISIKLLQSFDLKYIMLLIAWRLIGIMDIYYVPLK